MRERKRLGAILGNPKWMERRNEGRNNGSACERKSSGALVRQERWGIKQQEKVEVGCGGAYSGIDER